MTDHLRPLTNVLWNVRSNWYHLGIQLNIDHPTLEVSSHIYSLLQVILLCLIPPPQVIKFDCRDSVDDCFTSVLTHFLKRGQPPPTWSDLVTALQSPPVNQPQLVPKIRELASSMNKVSFSTHTNSSFMLSRPVASNFCLVQLRSWRRQLAAFPRGVWGHAPPGKF